MQNEIVVAERNDLEVKTLDDVLRVAGIVSKSGLAPKDLGTPEKVAVAIMQGRELGLPPMASLNSIAVINGRPTLWGDAMLGLAMQTGQLSAFKEWYEGEGDAMAAYCKASRGAIEVENKFSVAMAKKAGLWSKGGVWQSYPARMLAMRARSWTLRTLFSDVYKGLSCAEEMRDVEEIDAVVTPMQSDAADIITPEIMADKRELLNDVDMAMKALLWNEAEMQAYIRATYKKNWNALTRVELADLVKRLNGEIDKRNEETTTNEQEELL